MAKNIDYEIYQLKEIKKTVDTIKWMLLTGDKVLCLSQRKYDELSTAGLINKDTVYYIADSKTGQYIDGYIE